MATSLGTVGIVNKGTYDESATYLAGNFVFFDGSTYLCIKDGISGVLPVNDGTNWQYLAVGAQKSATQPATKTTLGLVMAGDGIDIGPDGKISAQRIQSWGDLAGK